MYAISPIMFHGKIQYMSDLHIYQLNYGSEYFELGMMMWYQQKVKYADSKSSAYLRGTWLKTKKYQTVVLAFLRYVYKYANYRTLKGIYQTH
jgi:hypothetical protein